MITSKRIAKLKNQTSPSLKPQSESPKYPNKLAKTSRCRFKQIPQNSKFSQCSPLYPLYGDIPVMHFQDGLTTDISFFNHFKSYKHIVVAPLYDQKIITIRPNPRTDCESSSPSETLDSFSESGGPEMKKWADITKVFYQKYIKVMKRQTRKTTKCDVRKKFYSQVTLKTEQTKRNLIENYPYLELNFRLKNHQSQLSEIIFDEKFVKELGYTSDCFVTTVLNEGIPQLMTYESSIISGVKTLIEKYFHIENDGLEMPEQEATLIMKNGYVKKVKYQMHVLMNYETNSFGMDVILTILSKGEPYLADQTGLKAEICNDFVQEMSLREREAEDFLLKFYDQTLEKRYTNKEKVCTIKEIN